MAMRFQAGTRRLQAVRDSRLANQWGRVLPRARQWTAMSLSRYPVKLGQQGVAGHAGTQKRTPPKEGVRFIL